MNITDIERIANQNAASFEKFKKDIFPVTMRWEGGGKLHNVSGDSGGWTKYGIAYNYHKKYFSSFEEFKNMKEHQAAALMFVIFFLGSKAHLLPCEAQHYYYDMAVNLGVNRTVKYMQRCAGVTSDGIIGPNTLYNMKKVTKQCLHQRRVAWYNYLGAQSRYKKFHKGWLNRANAIYKLK